MYKCSKDHNPFTAPQELLYDPVLVNLSVTKFTV
jgi:hypothetical protein